MSKCELEDTAFSFVPGRFHGPDCLDLVRSHLERRGYGSVAPDFPIEDSSVSLDDHAEILANTEAESGFLNIVRVGWSWGANVVSRKITDSTKKIIYISAGFHPATIQNHPNGSNIMDIGHGLMYEIYQGLDSETRRGFAQEIFYHDVESQDLIDQAVGALREHPRREEEPILEVFPAIPLGYIALLKDRVNTLDYQLKTAWSLGVKRSSFNSGHAPMYARPRQLADRLIRLANGEDWAAKPA